MDVCRTQRLIQVASTAHTTILDEGIDGSSPSSPSSAFSNVVIGSEDLSVSISTGQIATSSVALPRHQKVDAGSQASPSLPPHETEEGTCSSCCRQVHIKREGILDADNAASAAGSDYFLTKAQLEADVPTVIKYGDSTTKPGRVHLLTLFAIITASLWCASFIPRVSEPSSTAGGESAFTGHDPTPPAVMPSIQTFEQINSVVLEETFPSITPSIASQIHEGVSSGASVQMQTMVIIGVLSLLSCLSMWRLVRLSFNGLSRLCAASSHRPSLRKRRPGLRIRSSPTPTIGKTGSSCGRPGLLASSTIAEAREASILPLPFTTTKLDAVKRATSCPVSSPVGSGRLASVSSPDTQQSRGAATETASRSHPYHLRPRTSPRPDSVPTVSTPSPSRRTTSTVANRATPQSPLVADSGPRMQTGSSDGSAPKRATRSRSATIMQRTSSVDTIRARSSSGPTTKPSRFHYVYVHGESSLKSCARA